MTDAEPPRTAAEDVLDSRAAGSMLLRGGALRFVGYAAMVGLSLLYTAALTRHLGTARFGQYTTVVSVTSLVAAVTDAGLSSLGTREYATLAGAAREQMMQDLLGLRVALMAAGVVISVAFALGAGYDPALLTGTLLAGLGTVALGVQHTLSIPLSAMLRLGTLSLLDFARQTLLAAGIVALVLAGAGVLPILAVPLVANLLLIPTTAALVRGRISVRPHLHPRRWAALLKPTMAFSVATGVGTVYVFTCQILTSLTASPHQSGLFAVSFRIVVVAAGVPGLIVGATLPLLARAARDDRERLTYALQRIFEVGLLAGLASVIAFVAAAKFIIAVVGGGQYTAAAGVLRIHSVALLASFLLTGWSYGVMSLHRHRRLMVANGGALLVSGLLTPVLAHTDGARGAAIATVAGESTLAVGLLVALVLGSPEFRPSLDRARRTLAAAVPPLALALFAGLAPVPAAVLALGLYATLALLLRAVPEEITVLIPGLRKRA